MEEPMPDLKKISPEAIPRAITKAERYRLLNQSWATESICLDILEIDPANQPVLVMLLLALTDQFGPEPGDLVRRAQALLERITDPYQRAYYSGIISERLGHAQLAHGAMHAEALSHESLQSAMKAFERAEALRQPGNDDAILRWNTCARTLAQRHFPEPMEEQYEPAIGE
jgi:hypothetical protein